MMAGPDAAALMTFPCGEQGFSTLLIVVAAEDKATQQRNLGVRPAFPFSRQSIAEADNDGYIRGVHRCPEGKMLVLQGRENLLDSRVHDLDRLVRVIAQRFEIV